MASDFGLAAFERVVDSAQEQVIEKHRAAHAELVAAGFEMLVERSPVRTGAYRASHEILQEGGESPGSLFEDPNRPPPDEPFDPGFGVVIPAPDVGFVAESARSEIEFATNVVFRNQRFYAPFLEYGTSQMEPRLIYESTSQAVAALAERVAALVTLDER